MNGIIQYGGSTVSASDPISGTNNHLIKFISTSTGGDSRITEDATLIFIPSEIVSISGGTLLQNSITLNDNGIVIDLPDGVGQFSLSTQGGINIQDTSAVGITIDGGASNGTNFINDVFYNDRIIPAVGTAANPSINFISSNTGFYRPASNTIGIAGSGVFAATFSPTQAILAGSIRTVAPPSGGTSDWKLGRSVANPGSVVDTTRYIEIAIGATTVRLATMV